MGRVVGMGKVTGMMCMVLIAGISLSAQDWKGIPVPADAGIGYTWVIQSQSDEFNYEAPATNKGPAFFEKWTDFYHNAWTGPGLTVWDRQHVFVSDGLLQIPASRLVQNSVDKISTGCITSTSRVLYPVYIEANVKISNSVLASDVWLLSPDDTQEIDICEAYGGDRNTNEWFAERIHLSHHVFIRHPFQDYQPTDPGTWYYNGTIWREAYHRIGVYWKDPWNLEYYIDGRLVRSVSGEEIIDPRGYTNGTGLSKAMDIIINVEDQTWRSDQGLTPTDAELENVDNNTFKVDWIRVYKPVKNMVTGISLSKNSIAIGVGQPRKLTAFIAPENALNQEIIWVSTDSAVASVDQTGKLEGLKEGFTDIVVTSVEGGYTDTCHVNVGPDWVDVPVDSIRITPRVNEIPMGVTTTLTTNVYPQDATDTTVSWISRDSTIAGVDANGVVTGYKPGQVYIIASGDKGSKDSSLVQVYRIIPGSITVDDPDKYLSTEYVSGGFIDVVIHFEAGTGFSVTRRFEGVQCLLREMQPKWWGIEKEYVFSDTAVVGTRNGTTTIRIDLTGIPASQDLADGHFYFLYPRFSTSEGIDYAVDGLAPITILPSASVSDADLVHSSDLRIFPNPAKDRVTVSGAVQSQFTLTITDIQGRTCLRKEIQSGTEPTVNIRSLPAGHYLMHLEYEGYRKVFRLNKSGN